MVIIHCSGMGSCILYIINITSQQQVAKQYQLFIFLGFGQKKNRVDFFYYYFRIQLYIGIIVIVVNLYNISYIINALLLYVCIAVFSVILCMFYWLCWLFYCFNSFVYIIFVGEYIVLMSKLMTLILYFVGYVNYT